MANWDAWFPLYVGEFVVGTRHLPAAAVGCYINIICHYWVYGAPPDDEVELARIAGADSLEQWRAVALKLRPLFSVKGGRWKHKRIAIELENAQKRYAKAAKNGSLGGLKKARNIKDLARVTSFSLGSKSKGLPSTNNNNNKETLTACESLESGPSAPLPTLLSAGRSSPPRGADAQLIPEIPKHVLCPHAEILALWAEVLPELPRHDPHQWHETRRAHLQARWRETAVLKGWKSPGEGLAYLRALFAFIGTSKFLTGKVPARGDAVPFMAELEWVAKRANWAKIVEGKYHQEIA